MTKCSHNCERLSFRKMKGYSTDVIVTILVYRKTYNYVCVCVRPSVCACLRVNVNVKLTRFVDAIDIVATYRAGRAVT